MDWQLYRVRVAGGEAMSYAAFLERKRKAFIPCGFEATEIPEIFFPFQSAVIRLGLRKGRFAMFEDCGLGKTGQQSEWARQVVEHTGGRVIIFAPLAVVKQTALVEGPKFGVPMTICKTAADLRDGVNITNYERLEHFIGENFSGIVLDESSILKGFDGKTRKAITDFAKDIPYRLCCTATPAPNDYMELGNHAEFLGVMTLPEMLATFFVHDGGDTAKWRLKRHATKDFWKWVCSWAVAIRRPSDIGFEDGPFVLPELRMHQITVASPIPQDCLFPVEAKTLDERRGARKESIASRVAACASLVNKSPDQFMVWCNLNAESEALRDALEAIEVTGSDSEDWKSDALLWASDNLDCICGYHDKLAAWRKKATSRNITAETEPRDLLSQSSTSNKTGSGGDDICGNGQPPIKTGSQPIEKKPKSEEMLVSGSYTQQRNHADFEQETLLGNGLQRTPTSASLKDCARIVSHQMNSARSLQNNPGPVPSVEIAQPVDSMSITITSPERSEGYSAKHAITASENSAITHPSSAKPSCICRSRPKRLVTKASMWGFGSNLQAFHSLAVVGLSDSWEQFYQLIRRHWRFGQRHPVDCYVITSEAEGAVVKNIERKERQAQEMMEGMVAAMKDEMNKELHGEHKKQTMVERKIEAGDGWAIVRNDCVDELQRMQADSMDYSIFSPPFASLYTYSNSDMDMGNCGTHDEFYQHMRFLVAELFRVLKPGRLVSFHCMNLPRSKERDGVIGVWDFRGNLIRLFEEFGFIFHSEVCIWKDPVTAMQRTKAIGLLYKQLRKDSALSRQGIPDYLVTMRKPGENEAPVTKTHESFPVALWQRYASPVWMDINPSDTLQKESAREHEDERHICPLQLEVIKRGIELWTNPGDVVLSPFAGIGSEGYVALQNGRRFHGVELKDSYFRQAVGNLKAAKAVQAGLFSDLMGTAMRDADEHAESTL
jgi:hypothetical protein